MHKSVLYKKIYIIVIFDVYYKDLKFIDKPEEDSRLMCLYIIFSIYNKHKYFTNKINLMNYEISSGLITNPSNDELFISLKSLDDFGLVLDYERLKTNLLNSIKDSDLEMLNWLGLSRLPITTTNKLKDYL